MFRALIPLEHITDPELRSFVTDHAATWWMGPDRHVQGYPISNRNMYNVVLAHPETGSLEESWTARTSKQELLDHFSDWDPTRLRKLPDLIPDKNVMKWRLHEHDLLPTWVIRKLVHLGDACHPMLTYIAQGAA